MSMDGFSSTLLKLSTTPQSSWTQIVHLTGRISIGAIEAKSEVCTGWGRSQELMEHGIILFLQNPLLPITLSEKNFQTQKDIGITSHYLKHKTVDLK